ncbi:MAG TPA: hypothetical protein DIU35_08765 [Candidatus Latescibacteria bacterium]|nr:hypothetical protein [Candidatus Latescibacterota bacterium]
MMVRLSRDDRGHKDKDPCLTRDNKGTLWVAWHHYRMKEDHILLRSLRGNRKGEILEISETPGINFQPKIACDGQNKIWVVWSAQRNGEWCILARSASINGLSPVQKICSQREEQAFPAITSDQQGNIWVAWSSVSGKHRSILGRHLHHGKWSDTAKLSQGKGQHYRPVLCGGDRCAWLAYQTELDGAYDIYIRNWQTVGVSRISKLSLTNSWELFPRLCPDGTGGVWATWIATHDVTNNKGFIDHKVEAMAASFDGERVVPYQGKDKARPPGYVTHLYDGLLGRNWYMGFVGWRRRPQIIRTEEGEIWLLYERKEDERFNKHGPDSILLGKPLTGLGRANTYKLGRHRYAWTINGDLEASRCSLPIAGQIPVGKFYADICAGTVKLDRSSPMKQTPASRWTHWKPVTLPQVCRPSRRPTLSHEGKSYKLYWGDPHCHGNLSGDAEGEIDENYTYGRTKGCLDFMAVTDNDAIYDNILTPSEWTLIRSGAAHFNQPGKFVALSAYERTALMDNGSGPNHRIMLFPGDDGPLYHWTEPDANSLRKWVNRMKDVDAYTFPHHATWSAIPSQQIGGVEVCSSWDIYIKMRDTIPEHLEKGYKLAFQGDSDSHRIVPGQGGALTGVWAQDLTRDSILEALRARRCFATNGNRTVLDFRANGHPVGSEVSTAESVQLNVRINAPRRVKHISLYRNGKVLDTIPGGRPKVSYQITDRPGRGTHFYYAEVELTSLKRTPMGARCGNLQVAEGDYAWSSPIWVTTGTQKTKVK